MTPDPVVLLLLKVFEGTSLLATLTWIVDYTLQRGWHNVVGRNLLTKTTIISLLLAIALAFSLFRFSPFIEEILTWMYLVLLAAIGPVMVWRMWLLHQVSEASALCPAGHSVLLGGNYCPVCGLAMPAVPGDSVMTPPEGIPAAD